MLYDLVQCPHRVTMDLYGDSSRRDKINPFVQLLWDKGTLFEREVITGLDAPFTDLSRYTGEEKAQRTLEAMGQGDKLIYGGRIEAEDLLGDPDLLRRDGDFYLPGDIKSGAAEEGGASKPVITSRSNSCLEHCAAQVTVRTPFHAVTILSTHKLSLLANQQFALRRSCIDFIEGIA